MHLPLISIRVLRGLFAASVASLAITATPIVSAQELKLALSSPPTSMDPHFYNLFANLNVSDHMFETLVTMDPDSRTIPSLGLPSPGSWSMM